MTTDLEFLVSKREIEIFLAFTNQIIKCVVPKRDGVSVEWRRPRAEEIYDLFAIQNVLGVAKSGRLKRAGQVALWETMEMHTGFWWRNPKEKGQLYRQRYKWDYNIKIKRILK
jgi:hypothetical protein